MPATPLTRLAAVEATLMINPSFCLRIVGSAAIAMLKAPVRLTASTRSQSSAVISSSRRLTMLRPALLTRMSTRANRPQEAWKFGIRSFDTSAPRTPVRRA
jgi:hypothetical protein